MPCMLFFDDQRLFRRENLQRAYGAPQWIPESEYRCTTHHLAWSYPNVWKQSETSWHLFYTGFYPDGRMIQLALHSKDGVHFAPRNTARLAGIAAPVEENQVFENVFQERNGIFENPFAPPEKRLHALLCENHLENLQIDNVLYTSPDGVHWTREPVLTQPAGSEPGGGCFFSRALNRFIIMTRPQWGTRRSAIVTTRDFVEFTPPEWNLQCDSLDEEGVEIYGMPAFAYKDMYIGMPWLYHTIPSDTWKFHGGTIDCQLAYSLNGLHWQRSLREPFLAAEKPFEGMVYPNSIAIRDNGEILIYASRSVGEHGICAGQDNCLGVYRLREDGFIALQTRPGREGRLVTRQMVCGDMLSINLSARHATCAILDAQSRPIVGFGHEDCQPFSGDNVAWSVRFSQDLKTLKGRVVVLEIRLRDGSIWSISGNFVPLMNTQAMRYERWGEIPDNNGF